jgi:hypothetical protein
LLYKLGNSSHPVKEGITLPVFPESFVGSFVSYFSLRFFQPTGATILLMIEFRDIGLDVQERRSVQDVDVLNLQGAPPDLDKFHYGKPDRIGPLRGSCGENAPRFRIEERGNGELITAASWNW